jgi:hypothetical protein
MAKITAAWKSAAVAPSAPPSTAPMAANAATVLAEIESSVGRRKSIGTNLPKKQDCQNPPTRNLGNLGHLGNLAKTHLAILPTISY